jgi:hypothetical protein
MDYLYKKPEKLSFNDFVADFIPNYEGISQDSHNNFQNIEVWAQTYCIPPYFPYNPATCWPIG